MVLYCFKLYCVVLYCIRHRTVLFHYYLKLHYLSYWVYSCITVLCCILFHSITHLMTSVCFTKIDANFHFIKPVNHQFGIGATGMMNNITQRGILGRAKKTMGAWWNQNTVAKNEVRCVVSMCGWSC